MTVRQGHIKRFYKKKSNDQDDKSVYVEVFRLNFIGRLQNEGAQRVGLRLRWNDDPKDEGLLREYEDVDVKISGKDSSTITMKRVKTLVSVLGGQKMQWHLHTKEDNAARKVVHKRVYLLKDLKLDENKLLSWDDFLDAYKTAKEGKVDKKTYVDCEFVLTFTTSQQQGVDAIVKGHYLRFSGFLDMLDDSPHDATDFVRLDPFQFIVNVHGRKKSPPRYIAIGAQIHGICHWIDGTNRASGEQFSVLPPNYGGYGFVSESWYAVHYFKGFSTNLEWTGNSFWYTYTSYESPQQPWPFKDQYWANTILNAPNGGPIAFGPYLYVALGWDSTKPDPDDPNKEVYDVEWGLPYADTDNTYLQGDFKPGFPDFPLSPDRGAQFVQSKPAPIIAIEMYQADTKIPCPMTFNYVDGFPTNDKLQGANQEEYQPNDATKGWKPAYFKYGTSIHIGALCYDIPGPYVTTYEGTADGGLSYYIGYYTQASLQATVDFGALVPSTQTLQPRQETETEQGYDKLTYEKMAVGKSGEARQITANYAWAKPSSIFIAYNPWAANGGYWGQGRQHIPGTVWVLYKRPDLPDQDEEQFLTK